MLITRLRLRVSYAYDRRNFNHRTRASYQNIMLMDIDPCQHRPRIWDVSLRQPIILYVERNATLRIFMNDMFDLAGWHVHRAFDVHSAESLLRGTQRFSLLLTADELPPLSMLPASSGLQLVALARSLPHRREMPILFFSIEDREREAKAAGANEFLRKPHDLFLMVDAIRKLLAAGGEKG
jgi:CheY-like chemotaxis protein